MYEIRIGIDDYGIGIDMSKTKGHPILQGIADELLKYEENVELYF